MKQIYGIPLWVMKKYLTDLGGVETETDTMSGSDWQAVVRKSEPARLGSLVIGRIEVEFSGQPEALESLLEKLHWKTLRGGG